MTSILRWLGMEFLLLEAKLNHPCRRGEYRPVYRFLCTFSDWVEEKVFAY